MSAPSTPERRARVMTIFEAALDHDVADRPAFLDAACGDDIDLRRQVEALLDADADASDFLERTPTAAFRAAVIARGIEPDAELPERLQRALGDAYRVERELFGGGMSRVFVAEEPRLGRRVVVKVLPPGLARGLDVDRFHREVRVVATLRHPHIVPLLTAGESGDGLLYYTMPFIEGESLRVQLDRDGALPAADVVRIVREVADALAYAHRRGVVHRDVKPANVLVDGDHVVVSDFGIAKALHRSEIVVGSATGTSPNTLTERGLVLGTPAYMSPEQAAGTAVDGRSDVYSLALMTLEMLTGDSPIGAVQQGAALRAASTAPMFVRAARRSALPRALQTVIGRALARDPADRFQTADELARAIDSALASAGRRMPTLRWRAVLLAAIVVIAVIAAALIWRATHARTSAGDRGIALDALDALEAGLPAAVPSVPAYWHRLAPAGSGVGSAPRGPALPPPGRRGTLSITRMT